MVVIEMREAAQDKAFELLDEITARLEKELSDVFSVLPMESAISKIIHI